MKQGSAHHLPNIDSILTLKHGAGGGWGKGVGGNWDRPKYSPSHQQQRSKTESNDLELHNFPESSLTAKKAAIPLNV